jgi:ribosome-associated protein
MTARVAGKNKPVTARQLAIAAARLAFDSHCEEVLVLDVRQQSPVTDFYVIGTGTSDRQIRSVADEIAAYGKQHGYPAWHMAGETSAQWIVLDFVDVVVHLFDDEHRHYYDLELLWGDAKKVAWVRRTKKTVEE